MKLKKEVEEMRTEYYVLDVPVRAPLYLLHGWQEVADAYLKKHFGEDRVNVEIASDDTEHDWHVLIRFKQYKPTETEAATAKLLLSGLGTALYLHAVATEKRKKKPDDAKKWIHSIMALLSGGFIGVKI